MIEVDRQGAPHRVGDLDDRAALGMLADTIIDERRVGRRRIRLVLQLVEINPCSPADAAQWRRLVEGQETLEGGDDRPEATASTDAAIATALATSPQGAQRWISDALDIRFRLPRLHARLEELEVDLWKVRQVARLTHCLPAEVAAFVDAALEHRIDKVGMVGIEKAVALAIATLLPERLEELDRRGRSGWHVDVHHPKPVDFDGTSFLDASADSLDIEDFAAGLRQIAHELAEAGDTDPLPLRMAKALGVMGRRITKPVPDAPTNPADPDAKRKRAPKPLQIFVRTTTDDDGQTHLFGEVPRWGVVAEPVLDRWLASHQARVTRVVDLARQDEIDEHDPPQWMRAIVSLRDRHCVFPGCARPAEDCDQDHIVPYDPNGPPGQTAPDKLACLCRRHHLLKTHAGWRYHRDRRGNYVWTSPHGRVFVVDTESGTDHLLDQAA
ncbi:MAG TPA: DUF222 domain-containing protein [Marmoricola sp.]|jgi:hypothetical protein|nr:DUF222 domain-containing protein [Marmoricola sp.]